MVLSSHGLIPARFLSLVAHLTITVTILWSRDENVQACLPAEYTEEEYKSKDYQIVVGLSVALGLIAFEFLGFMSGVTMFMTVTSMVSIASHASASVLLAHFVLDAWDCNLYWWVFAFCSALPALIEAVTALGVLVVKKN